MRRRRFSVSVSRPFGTRHWARRGSGGKVRDLSRQDESKHSQVSTTDTIPTLPIKRQGPVYLVALGHATTHWMLATLYILLPFLTKDLGLSYVQAGLFLTIIHVSALICNFGSGLVVDLTGRRVIFLGISLLTSAVALLILGSAPLYSILCVAVGMIGASNNLWHSPAISFLSSEFPRNRGYVLAIHATGASLGDAVAPAVAGFLLLALSWRETAMINAPPVFVVAVVLFLLLLPRDRVPREGGGKRGMSFADYLAGLRQIVGTRSVLGLTLTAGFRGMAQSGVIAFLPLYLVHVLEFNSAETGMTVMMMQVCGLIAALIAGTLSDRVGRRPVIYYGLTATTVVIIATTFISDPKFYVAAVSVLGFTLFAIRPVIQSWMMDMTPRELGGSATSLLFGSQALMASITPILGGLIADAWGLGAVFYMLAGFMLIANVLMYSLKNVEAPA